MTKKKNKLNYIEKGVLTFIRVLFWIFVISAIVEVLIFSFSDTDVADISSFRYNFLMSFFIYMVNPVYKHFRRIELKK